MSLDLPAFDGGCICSKTPQRAKKQDEQCKDDDRVQSGYEEKAEKQHGAWSEVLKKS